MKLKKTAFCENNEQNKKILSAFESCSSNNDIHMLWLTTENAFSEMNTHKYLD